MSQDAVLLSTVSVLVALLELSEKEVRYRDKRGRVEGRWKPEGEKENNGVQNESSGMGGYETEICTNLRLLVMSGDKLHRQKESGWRMGARMERWWLGSVGGWERETTLL